MSDQAPRLPVGPPLSAWILVSGRTYCLKVPGGTLYRAVDTEGHATMVFAPDPAPTPPTPAPDPSQQPAAHEGTFFLGLYISDIASLHRVVGRACHSQFNEPRPRWEFRYWISSAINHARSAGIYKD